MTVLSMPSYPLEEVLVVKHRRVEAAERVVREKQKALAAEKDKLARVEKERDQIKEHYVAKVNQLRETMDGGTTSDKIHMMKIYIKTVQEKLDQAEKKVKDQQQQVELAQKNLEVAQALLKEKEKEKDKLETHKKEWTKITKHEMYVAEVREEDDLGTTMFLSRFSQEHAECRREQHKEVCNEA